MRVDILKRVLYLLCRSEERIKKCGRDELPARSTAVRAVPRPKSVFVQYVIGSEDPNGRAAGRPHESGSSRECKLCK